MPKRNAGSRFVLFISRVLIRMGRSLRRSVSISDVDDGEVTSWTWNNRHADFDVDATTGHVGVNADGITDPGIYIATYSYNNSTLTVDTKTMTRVSEDPPQPGDARINKVSFGTWGTAQFVHPLKWVAPPPEVQTRPRYA